MKVEVGATNQSLTVGPGRYGRGPLASNFARMKLSIGFRTAAVCLTSGTEGRTTLRKDHHDGSVLLDPADSHLAPESIQSPIVFTSAAVRDVLPGGICRSPSRFTALNSKALGGFARCYGGSSLASGECALKVAQIQVGHARLSVAITHFASIIEVAVATAGCGGLSESSAGKDILRAARGSRALKRSVSLRLHGDEKTPKHDAQVTLARSLC